MLADVPAEVLGDLLGGGALLQIHEQKPGAEAPTVDGAILVRAEPSRVFEVLCDLESYPRFMPQVDRVKVIERSAERLLSDHRLKLKFGVLSMKLDYQLIYEVQRKDWRIDYRHSKGALPSVRAFWQLKPLDEDRTAMIHGLTMNFREAGFVARKALDAEPALQTALQASTVSITLKATRDRAE